MYGFKEKMKYFNELRNSAAAGADLALLQAAAPEHPKLKMFVRNPQRYADDILYTLLDLKSKDAIRINRRESEKNKRTNGEENISDTSGTCAESEIQSGGDTSGNCDKAGNALDVSQQLLSDNSEGSGGAPVRSSETEDSHDGNTKRTHSRSMPRFTKSKPKRNCISRKSKRRRNVRLKLQNKLKPWSKRIRN